MIDSHTVADARRALGRRLAAYRRAAGLSQKGLAPLVQYGRSTVANVEIGRQKCSQDFWRRCDEVLAADGALLAAYETVDAHARQQHQQVAAAAAASRDTLAAAIPEREGETVHRRRLLIDLSLVGLSGPLAVTERVRHGLAAFAGADTQPDVAEWEAISVEYARSFYRTPVDRLLRDLTADLSVLAQHAAEPSEHRRDLARTGAQLAAIAAMAWASAGEVRHAQRWWRTARQLADRSADTRTRMWVRGWEVANGLYEQRPIPVILELAAASTAIGGAVGCAGTAGMYAGLAQTLAVAGRADEAIAALRQATATTEMLPSSVVADEDSMFGWPEVRLRHTASFVHTWLGQTRRAYAAQDEALRLYPENLARERAALRFHRSACLIHDGNISGGVGYAGEVLDRLPPQHHTELVYAMGRAALRAVPPAERERRDVVALSNRLTLPAGRSDPT
jgi:tetratricopeptide (TPR) repeat protein